MNQIKLQYRQYSIDPDLPVFCFTSRNKPVNRAAALNDGGKIRYMHLHNCIEIACVNADGGEFCADGMVYPLQKDDLVVVMPYCAHILRENNVETESDYLDFDPTMFMRDFCPEGLPVCEIFESKNSPACAVLRGEEAGQLRRRVREILAELQGEREHSHLCIKALLLALIIELARFPGSVLPMRRRTNSAAPILPAVQYINDHFQSMICIGQLHEMCHLSGTHFRRLFGTIMGCSPLEYIHNLRISRACDMLLFSNESILNIALGVGFDSISSFNRQFRKIVGTTPSAWRKERLGDSSDYLPASTYDVQNGRFCTEDDP